MAFIFSMKESRSGVPPAGIHLPETMSARASGEMVLGSGIARWIWAVPSLSKVVYGSAATDCAFDCNANAAGMAKRDESDLRVISCLHDLHTQVHSLEPGIHRDPGT